MSCMKHVRHVLVAGLVFFFIVSTSHAGDGLYQAVADDGIILKMKRYRPTPDTDYNDGSQPVLLFSGIVCNMNEFMTHTPDDRIDDYKDMELPQPIAEWAVGDAFIEEDPMRYYSIAYYLWSKGYDPWFANYRGTGRGDFESDKGDNLTTLDVWAALDAPACIKKVYDETGIHPVIGGHSTGGLVSYCYLQGISFDKSELGKGYLPHLKFDTEVAKQRNSEIKGFIGLDPAAIPPFPDVGALRSLVYPLISRPIYLDLDYLFEDVVNPRIKDSRILITTIDAVFGMISGMHNFYDQFLGMFLPQEFDIFGYLNFWQVDNTHPYVEDYFARYGTSSVPLRAISQYVDFLINSTIREHWMNGEENADRKIGPEPNPGEDGYYYYKDNMNLLSVPAIVLLSYYDSLVESQEIIDDIMEAKTKTPHDAYYIVPDSSHVDVPVGLNAPTFSFPKIGAWLEDILATPEIPAQKELQSQPAVNRTIGQGEDNGSQEDDTAGGCFISNIWEFI